MQKENTIEAASVTHHIHIRREALKFSSAHMTVFPDGSKEALHGHNYTTEVSIQLRDISLPAMLSFSYFKKLIKGLCEAWDEKVLVPGKCPFLKITEQSAAELEFVLCGKRYVLPSEEVLLLPLDNITAETLADCFGRQLIAQIDPQVMSQSILEMKIRIEEAPGQGSTFCWSVAQD
jgi:6-pyruvoyltetrahydropterin/6-carboxytetrahydropterin synthase